MLRCCCAACSLGARSAAACTPASGWRSAQRPAAEWVTEAYTRYGGLSARIAAAQNENGGSGLHFAGAAQARALAGPVLCRGTCHVSASVLYQLWWFALAALVVIAVAHARRHGQLRAELVPLFVGLAAAAQYVFAVTYAASRFLIPAYALLSIPCASGLLYLLWSARGRAVRIAVGAGLAVGLLAHAALQIQVITAHIKPGGSLNAAKVFGEARQLRALGVRPPCLVLGSPANDQNLAYATDCSNVPTSAVAVRDDIEDGTRVAYVRGNRLPTVYGDDWRRGLLAGTRYAYLSTEPRAGREDDVR